MEEADFTDNAKKYLTTSNEDDDDAENAVSQNEENHSRMADSFIEPEKEAQTDGEGLNTEASQTAENDLEVVEGANEASQTVEVEVEVEKLDVEMDDDNDVVSPAISRGASAKSQRSTVANLGVEDEEDSDEKTLVEEEPEQISQDELDSEEKEAILEIEENAKEMDDEDMEGQYFYEFGFEPVSFGLFTVSAVRQTEIFGFVYL